MDDAYEYAIVYDQDSGEFPLLRVSTSGVFDYLTALRMWREINSMCARHCCKRILIVSGMARPLPRPDVFDSREFFEAVGPMNDIRLAAVAANTAVRESHKMAETALYARAKPPPLRAASFGNEADAMRWLQRAD